MTIEESDSGQRLDRWMRRTFPWIPYSAIQSAIREGKIRMDQGRSFAHTRLILSQQVRIYEGWFHLFGKDASAQEPISYAWKEKIASWVLYEDDDMIGLNKPQGLATQGGTKQRISLDVLMKPYRLVHRLDKETSGVLLMAKTLSCAQILTQSFQDRKIEKEYWGVIHGHLEKEKGKIHQPLWHKDKNVFQEATTHYRVMRCDHPLYSLVQMFPETGRMHQLRIHMAFLGCPLVGDGRYGLKKEKDRLQLHCRSMRLPCGQEIVAPVPKESLFSLFH